MRIGLPKEVKQYEYRVGLTPVSIREIRKTGANIFVQAGAGASIGFTDKAYKEAGAEILTTAKEVFEVADIIIKVKEPQPEEIPLLRPGQVLFTFLHLAANKDLTLHLLEKKIIGIAYETVTSPQGGLPLLAPMSEIAGRLSIELGAHYLERSQGGPGLLLSGVPGVKKGEVLIIGAGSVGTNAAQIALGLGANVTILDTSIARLHELEHLFGNSLQTLYSTETTLEKALTKADLIIGAILIPGASAPKLIKRSFLKKMKKGAVFVDVAIDQGGCSETSKPTTHKQPTYQVDGITHYCVPNIPSAVAQTATESLNNVTLPFILEIASKGIKKTLAENEYLRTGLNVWEGTITYKAVADSLTLVFVAPQYVIGL